MLRNTGALRAHLCLSKNVATKNRGSRPTLGFSTSYSRALPQERCKLDCITPSGARAVIYAHVRDEVRGRKRANAMPIVQCYWTACSPGGVKHLMGGATFGVGVGARRMIFSGRDGGWFQRLFGAGSGETTNKFKDTMDEETRASIRRGDAKRKRSMTTVKLALGGNLVIAVAKMCAYHHSGSSSMWSESLHSFSDCANQVLLLIGLKCASMEPNRVHQYGQGKDVYVWSLLSAISAFWVGAALASGQSYSFFRNPTVLLDNVGFAEWSVLLGSLAVDGFVLGATLKSVMETKPKNVPLLVQLKKLRDPTTAAVLLEDGGACIGVLMAMAGLGLSQVYQNSVYDSVAGAGITALLGAMGLILIKMNRRYLLGQAVDPDIIEGVKKILLDRSSIENLHQVRSQWVGPFYFAFKAEVDFDGTYLAAKLRPKYQNSFAAVLSRPHTDKNRMKELQILLSFYAEDVMRVAEREVRQAETDIRKRYPEATYVDLEPDSSNYGLYALTHYQTPALKKEEEAMIAQMDRDIQRRQDDKNPAYSDSEPVPPDQQPKAEREGSAGMP